jgi:hypothetical protein
VAITGKFVFTMILEAIVPASCVIKKMEIGKNDGLLVLRQLCRNWHQNKSVFKTIPAFWPMSAKMWTAFWHQNKSVFKTIPAFWPMSAKMWTASNIFTDERDNVAGLWTSLLKIFFLGQEDDILVARRPVRSFKE